MKDAIIEIIKWIRESVRPVVVLLILSALVFFFPHSLASTIGLGDGFSKYRLVAFLCFVGSLVWLATFPIEKRYRSRGREKHLANLALDERDVLKNYILNNKKVHCFGWTTVAVAKHLADRGFLSATGNADGAGNPYFAIDAWTFSYLCEHPELVGIPKKSN